jgi:signal transduction histidine kinase
MVAGTRKAIAKFSAGIQTVRAGPRRAHRLEQHAGERLRELMTMAAHDLRTPLASIKLQSDRMGRRLTAGDTPANAEWAAAMSAISRSADNAFKLIDDLLAIERLDRHSAAAHSAPPSIDVEHVIEEAIADQMEGLARVGCRVTVIRQKGLVRARGPWDRGFLLRVLNNLLRNVVRHAPGASIRITLARRGAKLGLVVADRGPGLPDDTADPTDKRRKDGDERGSHGLGLWIVRRAVKRLNGRLRIWNTPGRGVAFDIELPGLRL